MEQHRSNSHFRHLLGAAAAFVCLSVWATGVLATTQKTEQVNLGDVQEKKSEKKKPQKAASNALSANEAFLVATETRLKSEIDKAIAYLSAQYPKMPKKSTTRLEMMERLVNLRLENAVYISDGEMRKYDRQWDSWDRGGRKGIEPKLDESKSRNEWQALASDSSKTLADYPRSKNADVDLFNMGLANNFLKKDKDAARIFSQLIAKYPNSQKAGDAYFALGDFYFDKSDFRNAMNNYKNALRFKQAKSYSWSLFKLGWCAYNLGQYKQGMAYWKATVSESARGGKKGLALKDEALRDMVYGFAELKEVEPAISYYKANGGDKYIGRFLLLLSDTFSDQGQYGQAITVLKRYQQVAPTAEDVPDTQKNIIGLDFELGRMNMVWAELERYPKLFGPGSPWAEKNRSDKKLYDEVQQTIKDQILYYAKLTHKNAQKDDNKRTYMEALKGYTLFLRNYPKAKEVAEVKYNMADIYYFAKNFTEAGKLYRDICLLGKDKAVIVDPKSGKVTNIHKQAADYMLDSYYQQFEPELKVMEKTKPDFKGGAKALSTSSKNFISACGQYTKWYPNEKKNVKTCDVFITEIFYRSNDKPMAKKYLLMLAKKYPNDKEGKDAVEELIPLYADDRKGREAVMADLAKIPAYQKGALGEKLASLGDADKIDDIKNDKNACTRAKKAEDFFKKKPGNKENDKLVYNAALDYEKCGKVPDAIRLYAIVLQKYPKSDGAQPSLLEIAKLQENRLELGDAAAKFLAYARAYPKDGKSAAALSRACEIQAAMTSESAVATCTAFANIDQNNGKIIFFRMMRNAFSSGETNRLAGLVRIVDSKFKLAPEEKIIMYAMVMNSGSGNAAQAANQIISTFQQSGGNVSGEALRAVGGLVFKRVNVWMAKFQAIKLKGGTVDALAASIQNKALAYSQLKAQYEQVLATKDAYWGVAALGQTGFASEQLAKELANPPDITGAPHADVVKQLAGDAKAAQAEAKQYYGKALEAVQKFYVYNEWAAKALSGMARVQGRNVAFDDLIVKPDFLGAEVPENIAQSVKGKGGGDD